MSRVYIQEKYLPVIDSVLAHIRKELDRCYWNKNHKEMLSPFDNTGESYNNDTFSVHAYDWGWDGNASDDANFKYKGLRVGWYKHCGRGMWADTDEPITIDYLAQMLSDCCKAIRRDFKEGN